MPENHTTKQPRRENPPPISPPARLTTYIGTPPDGRLGALGYETFALNRNQLRDI